MHVLAPAKLNLLLHVNGRLANGYHHLQSVFVLLDLADQLDLSLRSDGQIRHLNPLPGVPVEDDLMVRAAHRLQQHTQSRLGVDIAILKQIPTGAGLGGGSSDAASTLIALNHLWQCGLSRTELAQLGLELGADVPFFIFGQSAFAQGVGEQLQAFRLPPAAYVVLRPELAIATAEIFKSSLLRRDTPECRAAVIETQMLAEGGAALIGQNDLEPVALALYPSLDRLVAGLRAHWPNVRMTGSGSCFFIPCVDFPQAHQYAEEIHQWHQQYSTEYELGLAAIYACRRLEQHPLYDLVSD